MFSHYTSTILRIIPDPRAMVPYPGRYKDMATAAAALPVPPPETRPPRPPGNTPGSGPRKKTSQGTDSPLFPPKKKNVEEIRPTINYPEIWMDFIDFSPPKKIENGLELIWPTMRFRHPLILTPAGIIIPVVRWNFQNKF